MRCVPRLAVLLLFATTLRPAAALEELVMAVGGDELNVGDLAKKPFKLGLVPPAVQESLEDLDRHFKNGAWDKAFETLGKLRTQKPQGLAAGPNGLCEPLEQRLRRTLDNLDAQGRDAFRLFHDGEAKKALEAAVGKDARAKLEEVVQWYSPCPAADDAALRLGDELFEEGRAADAAALWQGALDRRSDAAPNAARLIFKLGLAYARGGRQEEVARLARRLKERHPDARTTVGGVEIDPGAKLAELAGTLPSSTVVADAGEMDRRLPYDLTLPPAGAKPVWRHEHYRPKQDVNVNNRMVQMALAGAVPPAAVAADGKLLLNHNSLVLALDLKTGKVAWRTDPPHKVMNANNQQQLMQMRMRFGGGNNTSQPAPPFAIARGGKLIANRIQGNPNEGTPFTVAVQAYEIGTGKKADDQTLAAGFGLASFPIFAPEGTYYIGAKPGRPTELHAVRMGGNGQVAWSTALGGYNLDPNGYYYGMTLPTPRCLLAGDRLYVETHWGAVLELDAHTGRIRWAAHYEADPLPQQHYYSGVMQTPPQCGPLAFADGMLFTKGMKSQRLLAFRVGEAGLAWQRPVTRDAVVLDAGDGRLVLGGEELLAFDTSARSAQWAARLPTGGDKAPALETPNQYAFCTARGVFLYDKRTGEALGVFRGADPEATGGLLLAADGLLITVTDIAATAYRMPGNPGATGAAP